MTRRMDLRPRCEVLLILGARKCSQRVEKPALVLGRQQEVLTTRGDSPFSQGFPIAAPQQDTLSGAGQPRAC